jgi:hypothetical protein
MLPRHRRTPDMPLSVLPSVKTIPAAKAHTMPLPDAESHSPPERAKNNNAAWLETASAKVMIKLNKCPIALI